MTIPVQITYRDIERSDALDARVRAHLEKLEGLAKTLTKCRFVLESPHRHHLHGRDYHVRIEMDVPGRTLTVESSPDGARGPADVHAAVDHAFVQAERALTEHMHQRHQHR
jgi:ribosome-associated translation inhibitor RaiA